MLANLHASKWSSILRSASALALRTSSRVDTIFGNTQDWTSGNCCACSSARGAITFAYVTCRNWQPNNKWKWVNTYHIIQKYNLTKKKKKKKRMNIYFFILFFIIKKI